MLRGSGLSYTKSSLHLMVEQEARDYSMFMGWKWVLVLEGEWRRGVQELPV